MGGGGLAEREVWICALFGGGSVGVWGGFDIAGAVFHLGLLAGGCAFERGLARGLQLHGVGFGGIGFRGCVWLGWCFRVGVGEKKGRSRLGTSSGRCGLSACCLRTSTIPFFSGAQGDGPPVSGSGEKLGVNVLSVYVKIRGDCFDSIRFVDIYLDRPDGKASERKSQANAWSLGTRGFGSLSKRALRVSVARHWA